MPIYEPTQTLPDGSLSCHAAVAILLSIPELRPHLWPFHEPTPAGLRIVLGVITRYKWPRAWMADFIDHWPIASDALNEAADRAAEMWAATPPPRVARPRKSNLLALLERNGHAN